MSDATWGTSNVLARSLGRRSGLTDQYLRVWRLILIQQEGAALSLGFQLPGLGAPSETGGPTVPTRQPTALNVPPLPGGAYAMPGQILEGESIFSSQVPTGQYPGLETRAAGLRIQFSVQLSANQSPNTAEITIYNLAKDTQTSLIREYNYCILQAGYEYGNAGTIFQGTIKMYKTGHESSVVDSYIKLYCADGDQGINGGIQNQTYPPGTDAYALVEDLRKSMEVKGDVFPGRIERNALVQRPNMRSIVHYGMSADIMRDFANANGAIWYVLQGKFNWTKPTSYAEGETVNLTAATGLIGYPEMTQDGINVTCLINPKIQLMQRIRIDNEQINQYWTPGGFSGATYQLKPGAEKQTYLPVQGDGIYAPLVISYEGDSRGQPWFMYMICVAVDPTADVIARLLGGKDWSFI